MKALETLVITAQNGNLDAFSEIVKRFQDMAFAVAYTALGDAELAEDVAQEAFIEAYTKLSTLKEPAAFPGWFRTIVVRQGHRFIRGKCVLTAPLETAVAISSVEPGPAASAEARELQKFVRDMIRALPEHERQVTTLFYIADYSQKEIAHFLGVRVSTVKSRLHAARNHLRERMTDMIKNTLHEQRPSKNDAFVKRVMAFIKAVEEGKLGQVKALLEQEPALVQLGINTSPVKSRFIAQLP